MANSAQLENQLAGDGCQDGCNGRCQGHRLGHGRLAALFGVGNAGVPSQQGPDYVSPQPKFHPIPTHPVFEPQLAALPPQLIEPANGKSHRTTTSAHRTGPPARLP